MGTISWTEVRMGILPLTERQEEIIKHLAAVEVTRSRTVERLWAEEGPIDALCMALDVLHEETIRLGREFDRIQTEKYNRRVPPPVAPAVLVKAVELGYEKCGW